MATVLILGATSDMAIAIARKFAANNYNVQLASRKTEDLKALQSDISIRHGVECSIHSFDATNFDSHASFFHELSEKPDVTVCVFGYLGENEKARSDWH